MTNPDIRWIQRFNNFKKAFVQLREAVSLAGERPLSNLERQGLIHAFEYTHELAWNTLKDFLESRGTTGLYGSKDATREAFKRDLIEDDKTWMDMIQSRSLAAHTYEEATAACIAESVIASYLPAFMKFLKKMRTLSAEEQA